MISTENIHRITKYFLFIALILFHLSFAQDEIELNEENLENLSWKPQRSLLYSDDSSGTSSAEFALYFLACTLVLIIGLVCQYCLHHGCQPMEYNYGNPMTSRRRRQNRSTSRFSRRRPPNPSSISSSSNSLSFEAGSQSRANRGIENPNYNPSIQIPASNYQQPSAPQVSWSEPRVADPTPILDMPPSYETAVNIEQFPSPASTGFAKTDEKQPLKFQRSGDDDKFLQFSASRRPYNSEGKSSPDYQQNISYKHDALYYKTVFFVVLGIGVAIFVVLLFVCNRVATVFEETNTSSVTGATVHPPNSRATYNLRVPDEIGITVSYVNSAYSSGPTGRSEVDRPGSDRPPDYSMVASTDALNRNAAFPQVVTTHIETPPPKYEDGGPVFR